MRSKLSSNYPAGMSICEREGLSGNCGTKCKGFQEGKESCECWNEIQVDGCGQKKENGDCDESCDWFRLDICPNRLDICNQWKNSLIERINKLKT